MLRLMKYEMIHSFRTFVTAFIAFLCCCVALPLAIKTLAGNYAGNIIISVMWVIFALLTIGVSLALFISTFMNYKRSMFDRPGYLTLTLPKSSLQILISKLIVAMVWIIIGMMVLMLGMTLLMALSGAVDIIEWLNQMGITMQLIISKTPNLFALLLSGVTDLCFIIATIYFSISIAHSKWIRRYRVSISVIIFLVLNVILGSSPFYEFIAALLSEQFVFIYYVITTVLLIWGTTYLLDHSIEVE